MGEEDLMKEIEDVTEQHRVLVARRDELDRNKGRVDAALTERKRRLKQLMDEAREAGLDPDNLDQEIRRRIEVIRVKHETIVAELAEAEKMIKPMLEEIESG